MKIYRLGSTKGWPIGPDEPVYMLRPGPSYSPWLHEGGFPNRAAARRHLRCFRDAFTVCTCPRYDFARGEIVHAGGEQP